MTRYLVFGFDDYYPSGGFADFVEEIFSEKDFCIGKYVNGDRCKYDNLHLIRLDDDGTFRCVQNWYAYRDFSHIDRWIRRK